MPAPAIFDLDGTVWDSAPGIVSSMEATLAEMGLPHPGEAVLAAALGPPLLELLVEIGVPRERLDEGRTTYRRHYRESGEAACRPFDGIAELLDRLRDAGIPTAVATSKGVEVAERMLDAFDLRRRFDVVSAASMTQAGVDKVEVIGTALAALAPLTADGPATMIGDRRFDIEGGRHHGLRTVAVTWGYAPEGELASSGADVVVGTVDELASVLLGGAG